MNAQLTEHEIQKALNDLPGWTYNGGKIKKQFVFADFREALSFIVHIGLEAESMQHHPELFNVYNQVEISLQTHDAGNKITPKDLDLAVVIQQTAARYGKPG